jgi:shikimate dehydrogenase
MQALTLPDLPAGPSSPDGRPVTRTGLIGREIQASRSPWLHEQEARALGVPLTYSLVDFAVQGWEEADLPRVLDALATAGFAGVNVTHPYKQAIIAHLDSLAPSAVRVGAVNTVQFADGKRIGHNTDMLGFAESMKQGLSDVAMGRIVQLGAGGAGSATAHALLTLGAGQIVLIDSDTARRSILATTLRNDYGADRVAESDDPWTALNDADGLVNATPVGMVGHPGLPLLGALIEPRLWIADIVYFPLETELLALARSRGCRTLDGSGMVVHQAAAAFDIFTGQNADRARMLSSFREAQMRAQVKAA